MEKKLGIDVTVFSTCNTLAKQEYFKHLEKADYICTSTNQPLKTLANKALIQLSITIPVYITTEKMGNIVLEYIKEQNDKPLIRRADLPYEDINTAKCIECEWI